MEKEVPFKILKGLVLTKIIKADEKYADMVIFNTVDRQFVLRHDRNCCEVVAIEDVTGDLDDLIREPILLAEEVSEKGTYNNWTFYKLATIKGAVTIRWNQEFANYSTEVTLFEIIDSITVPRVN